MNKKEPAMQVWAVVRENDTDYKVEKVCLNFEAAQNHLDKLLAEEYEVDLANLMTFEDTLNAALAQTRLSILGPFFVEGGTA